MNHEFSKQNILQIAPQTLLSEATNLSAHIDGIIGKPSRNVHNLCSLTSGSGSRKPPIQITVAYIIGETLDRLLFLFRY